MTQSAAISLANLALLGSSATYTLTGSSNSVGTLAANAGSVSFTDSTALTIGTIGTTSGITATGAVTLTTTGGSSNVTITGAISDSTGAFTIAGGNNISDTSSVNVGSFTLAGGNWLQNYATLTAADSSVFSATNFVISGGTFLRTVGSGENGTTVPYQLFDVYGLQGIATELATNFVLAETINAGGTVNWNGGAGFAPIGNYQGTLNGQGYSITNLVIDQPSAYSVGMFIFNSGTIENISLTAWRVSPRREMSAASWVRISARSATFRHPAASAAQAAIISAAWSGRTTARSATRRRARRSPAPLSAALSATTRTRSPAHRHPAASAARFIWAALSD